ncbi:CopG family ribbon-helix-helix protein [Candidatus Nitrosarchaeum limnium]|jgi:CopG family nickel-responsive transcriptional regulator|uniref:Ribbon-helix-helix protein, CopG family n=2 Tax=Candidatus Nitrosarchaeum limnium TaxID=1007084 RepID=S2E6C7_9ARCH|nr:CopG family ribbon-helix-helix protein [Candidatus Nitrosarchaeum limnium]EGG41610.1 transcription factor, NikR [Candidatus Nitrosarchaeum limnium SFB1]EPA06730.1 ribbon-helix-helix protein, CopG family [Candidatus Nitrosarchaeum limnium BG20]
MPIVSISLNQEILSELDKLQKSMGFSGRSEAIRAGIRTFVSEEKQKSELTGNIHAILLVVHNDEFDHVVSGIKHNFEDLITTHLHSKIEGEKCMELFVIDGDAERVSTITKDFQVNKNMDTVKLVTL